MISSGKKLPYGKIKSTGDIGELVRGHRKKQSATQAEFASLCGVGVRFISNLENGKSTMEVGKVLHVLHCLGLEVSIQPRSWKHNNMKTTLASSSTLKGTMT